MDGTEEWKGRKGMGEEDGWMTRWIDDEWRMDGRQMSRWMFDGRKKRHNYRTSRQKEKLTPPLPHHAPHSECCQFPFLKK